MAAMIMNGHLPIMIIDTEYQTTTCPFSDAPLLECLASPELWSTHCPLPARRETFI